MKRDLANDVIFRVWRKHPRTVIALWPAVAVDSKGCYCNSYEHIGQHSGADYFGCIPVTRPASSDEYADLLDELIRIGYTDLRVIHRATPYHTNKRREQCISQ